MYKVAQCWDDGNMADIFVAESCREFGAKATFNLCPGTNPLYAPRFHRVWEGTEIWRMALKDMPEHYQGFQIAVHTMTHPHPTLIPQLEFRNECHYCRLMLEELFQKPVRGFAYPFGEWNQACVDVLREEGFVYGRTTQYSDDLSQVAEPLATPTSCHLLSSDFQQKRQLARKTGVFYFWCHSYELREDPALKAYYREILADIANDPEAQWCDVIDLYDKK